MNRMILSVAVALLAFSAVPPVSLAAAPRPALQQQTQVKTFTGTVMKDGETFVLSDPGTKTSYMLDDVRKASQFEGKKVKVTGSVDVANNIIHVETIEEVA